ncbi:M48 family metallopeptidase [Sphingomicrobium clamense]|uniref:M48 family metallopeptidase n=1 Tax=Sphingomicrobium clamense TaxID=2851013 RepID=UPI002103D2A2|nr:YgjP-like metallopeptidase domain-containing protein [Sphingomicrobium sp. B8]
MLRTRSEPRLTLPGGGEVAIDLRPHPRAKRWSLRYDIQTDRVKLTCPKRASKRAALQWAQTKAEWVEKQRAKRAQAVSLSHGATIPFRGGDVQLVHDPEAPRTVRLEGQTLIAGGPADAFPSRVLRWLKQDAKRLLEAESRAVAARAGVEIAKVGVGDARTRWGTCSSEGSLRYSWRLILMPDAVWRYVVAHEVAHRRHMDHGPDFRALEAELFDGDVAEAKALLRLWSERVRLVG